MSRVLILILAFACALSTATDSQTAAGAAETQVAPPAVIPALPAEIRVRSLSEVDVLLDKGFDVTGVRGDAVSLLVTQDQWDWLEAQGYAPLPAAYDVRARQSGGYHAYAELTARLQDRAAAYPAICRLSSLGQTVLGREMWALLITDNPDIEEAEPEFKYVSTIHGDEPVGTELCLNFIDTLLAGYGTDADVTEIVNETAIWIVPLMNADGYEAGSRYNARGVDLNRSFPSYPDTYTGTIYDGEPLHDETRQPETAHVMRWIAANSFVLSANLHTGALLVNYPYDDDGKGSGNDAPTPDDLVIEDISLEYSYYNPPMYDSPYFPMGISNGSKWFSISGGMMDWNYRYAGCIDVTLELSNTKWPNASTLPQYWADNEQSMLHYLAAMHRGVRGLVTDATNGAPVYAKVIVASNAQPVFTDPDVGDYYRLLLPGTYTLTYSAPGFQSKTVPGIQVNASAPVNVNVELYPIVPATPDINNDGVIDAVDLQWVIRAAAGQAIPYAADIDGGGVSQSDVQLVLGALLGN